MSMLKTSIGFEISNNDLRVGIVKSVFGKLRFVGAHTIEGFVGMDDAHRQESLSTFFRKQKIGSGQYTLTLPHDFGIIRQLDFPSEIRDKLKPAVALQVESLSPWSLDEVYWDYSVESAKPATKTITINVGIVPRSALDPWIVFFKTAGFPLSAASLSSLAYAHGVTIIWPDSRPVVVLSCSDLGVEGVVVNRSRLVSLMIRGDDVAATAKT